MKNGLLAVALLLNCATALAASGDPTCAKVYTTLRKTPGGATSWKVARFMPFLRGETKGSWVKVQDLEGEEHWAQSKDLTNTVNCVVVKAAVAALREGPSQSSPSSDLKTLDKYTPLKKIESRGEWVHVEDETGRQAWIHESTIWKPVRIHSVTF